MSLLQTTSDAGMEAYEVDRKVGNTKFDLPSCIEPTQKSEAANADNIDAGEKEEDGVREEYREVEENR